MNFNHQDQQGPVMLSAAKHLATYQDRPFAALRVTGQCRFCLLKFIITPERTVRLVLKKETP
jgi:hypothetical protein